MSQDSIVTDEMRSRIGIESEPTIYEIEKEPIRRWAEAIGDPNPLYRDEEYAQKSQYGAIIAPPAFVPNYLFPAKGQRSWLGIGRKGVFIKAGDEYEFFRPVRAGDVLTATTKLVDLSERQGRTGKMLLQVTETTYRNQKGEVVVKSRATGFIMGLD